jgi:integral membrane sensor domain MASE1
MLCALLPVSYLIAGWFSLLLAVPPGYASPIFLPAGIAIAATYIAGPVVLPSIFIGSLALNAMVGYAHPQVSIMTDILAGCAIAMSSTFQAAIGGQLFRRLVRYPTPLDNCRDLAVYLTLSPIVCLVSATLSVCSLWLLQVVHDRGVLSNWLHWWAGDWFGLLLALPAIFLAFGDPRGLWRHRWASLAGLLIACFAAFAVAFAVSPTWSVIVVGLLVTASAETLLLLITGRSFRNSAAVRN